MSWSAIAAAEVLQEFTPAESAALNNIQGVSSGIANILARTVNAARGCVLAGGGAVDAVNTVPDQLRSDVIALTRWKFLISFPSLKALQTKERKDANDDAQKRLDDVANGKLKVELPDPTTALQIDTPVNAAQNVSKQKRQATNRKLEGLV